MHRTIVQLLGLGILNPRTVTLPLLGVSHSNGGESQSSTFCREWHVIRSQTLHQGSRSVKQANFIIH